MAALNRGITFSELLTIVVPDSNFTPHPDPLPSRGEGKIKDTSFGKAV
jgi:hypothetical protein